MLSDPRQQCRSWENPTLPSQRTRVWDGRPNQRPNFTTTLDPAVTWLPGAGDCSRAIPLPTRFSSRPLSSASSSALRTLFPTNEGTSMPPCSTSRTTVSLEAGFAESAILLDGRETAEGGCGAVSFARRAAGTTPPCAAEGLGACWGTAGTRGAASSGPTSPTSSDDPR